MSKLEICWQHPQHQKSKIAAAFFKCIPVRKLSQASQALEAY